MQIKILCENSACDMGFLAEWGFSAYVETKDTHLLFDTGYTDVFIHNAQKLGVNLEASDFVIISHSHKDHIGGLLDHHFSSRKKIIMHPDTFDALEQNEQKHIEEEGEVITAKKPLEFTPDIFFLGQIPRRYAFEPKNMFEDSAIAIKTEKGVFVITGCSHSGICNICSYAEEITGQKLYGVLGGFHLFAKDSKQVKGTLEYFQKVTPTYLFPMHCIDFSVLAQFYTLLGISKYSAGDSITI